MYVNSKETQWDELGNTIRSRLELRPRWIVDVEEETKCRGPTWQARLMLPEGFTLRLY
jgi:hypothetical protein